MSNINTILIKRRTTGQAGAPASLSGGELAFNEVNSVLYYGSENGVIPIGGTGEFATNTLVGSISADLSSQIGTLDLRVTDEVSTLNTTIQSVSSTLDAKIDAQIAAVIDFAPDALNTLNELASALGDDENFASNLVTTLGNVNSTIASVSSSLQSQLESLNSDSAEALSTEVARASAAELALDAKIDSSVSTLNTTVASVSSTLDSKIDSEVADLESAIASEVSTLNTMVSSVSAALASDLADEVTRATAAEGAISSLVSEISSNYLDKRTGGTVTGDLDVTGTISATGGLEISGDGESTSLFVGVGVVGVNTEAPSEAFEVVGNGKFSGTVEVATPSLSGHAANKGYVDTAIANLVDGAPELLNTLNELASAINDDESFAATIATNIGNVSTALASVSAALDSKIDSEVADLESAIASEVSTLNTTVQSVSSTLDSKIDSQISSLSSTVDANFVQKTESDAVTLNGGLTVTNGFTSDTLTVSGGVTFSANLSGNGTTSVIYGFIMDGVTMDGGSF
jgi:hypothetical protein